MLVRNTNPGQYRCVIFQAQGISVSQRPRLRRPTRITVRSAWEQRKLGDCFDFLRNNTLSRAELNDEDGAARNVHYGDILVKFGECLANDANDLPYISDSDIAARYAVSALVVGDIVFADTAEDDAAGKCLELLELPDEPTVSGLHTIPARPRFAFGPGYLGHYLNSSAYHTQLLPLMQGIKVISVSKSSLQDTSISFPSLPEQRLIGSLFARLDSLITLHQREAAWNHVRQQRLGS